MAGAAQATPGPNRSSRRREPSRRILQRCAIIALGFVAVAALASPSRLARGTLVWNYTPSLPVGLYRISSFDWGGGDLIAAKPTGHLAEVLSDARVIEPGRLLLKRVAGVPGDRVCRSALSITINGAEAALALSTDARGNVLPSWSGCRALEQGQVFLLGDHTASFDGRYFGPSRAADIIGRVTPVLVLDHKPK
jgi:conjugative transfer signal peptidase TraF